MTSKNKNKKAFRVFFSPSDIKRIQYKSWEMFSKDRAENEKFFYRREKKFFDRVFIHFIRPLRGKIMQMTKVYHLEFIEWWKCDFTCDLFAVESNV